MEVRRLTAALPISLALCAAAGNAQITDTRLAGPVDNRERPEASANLPRFEAPRDPIEPGLPRRNGLIAAYEVRDNLTIGVGRFAIPEIARPRTNMEREAVPTAVRRRDRGMAAVGVSLRF